MFIELPVLTLSPFSCVSPSLSLFSHCFPSHLCSCFLPSHFISISNILPFISIFSLFPLSPFFSFPLCFFLLSLLVPSIFVTHFLCSFPFSLILTYAHFSLFLISILHECRWRRQAFSTLTKTCFSIFGHCSVQCDIVHIGTVSQPFSKINQSLLTFSKKIQAVSYLLWDLSSIYFPFSFFHSLFWSGHLHFLSHLCFLLSFLSSFFPSLLSRFLLPYLPCSFNLSFFAIFLANICQHLKVKGKTFFSVF